MRRSILLLGPLPALALAIAAGMGDDARPGHPALEASAPVPPRVLHRISVEPVPEAAGPAEEGEPAFAAAFQDATPSELRDEARSRERQARHLAEKRAERSWGTGLAVPDVGPVLEDEDHLVLRRHGRRLVLRRAEHPIVFQLLDEARWLALEAVRRDSASSSRPAPALGHR